MRVSEPAMRAEWLRSEIAVIGLARSGRAVARLLARAGEQVYASDLDDSAEMQATAAQLGEDQIGVEVGRHDLGRIAKASLVVASPGVPPTAPPFAAARAAGVPIV